MCTRMRDCNFGARRWLRIHRDEHIPRTESRRRLGRAAGATWPQSGLYSGSCTRKSSLKLDSSRDCRSGKAERKGTVWCIGKSHSVLLFISTSEVTASKGAICSGEGRHRTPSTYISRRRSPSALKFFVIGESLPPHQVLGLFASSGETSCRSLSIAFFGASVISNDSKHGSAPSLTVRKRIRECRYDTLRHLGAP